MPLAACDLATPFGRLRLYAEGGALVRIWLPGEGVSTRRAPAAEDVPGDPVLQLACRQLGEYFAGTRHAFDLPLAPRGTTFQEAVWRALLAIPYGTTTSYAAIARAIGHPSAFRAVGVANGSNPLPIVIPCHRVVGSDGTLTGYGGGLTLKSRLLALERAAAVPGLFDAGSR